MDRSTLNKSGSVDKVPPPRDYESLKMQCEKACAEVQGLHKQNLDITRKYDNALKDVDYYRKQERAAYQALQNLRMQYEEVVTEKQKLEREVTSLQTVMEDDRKEIADLRRQQQEAMSQEGSGEAINQLYMTTMRKYEAIKDEYDAIRKRYSDLVASHSNNISKLELTQEEVSRLKKQYDEVVREASEAVREKNCLKQQCTEAIRQWDSALREKNKLQEELLKIREKYDEMMKEMNTHLMQRQHLNKDLKRLQEERNAVMQEYTLVMSERDTVHKEMDKLQEELSSASIKIKTIEETSSNSTKERESMLLQIEMLKREIAASLHDRDKAIKEVNDLRERFGTQQEETNKDWERSYKVHDTYNQDREPRHKEVGDVGPSSHDMYSKAQKERLDNLDQANQEIDRLRKTIDKLQTELQEGQQEAEVSKRRRDWAFSERDKIVQERESIRAHCDKLRRERDRAVSDLAEALRDSDDMKKQRNEASKELKELKERLEAEQEKAAVVRHLAAHNHSRDSAIDTDMQEWETETLHLQLNKARHLLGELRLGYSDIGFEVAGGRDDPHYGGNDGAIYVSTIIKDGPFDGKLRLHDQIVRCNGIECCGVERSSVYAAVLSGGGWVQMTVRRRRSGGRSLHTAHLHCSQHSTHGLTLHTGVYIATILPGSPAAREGNLAIGDRVLNINGAPVEGLLSCDSAQRLLDTGGDIIQLTTLKSYGSAFLSRAPLSSSSSGHNITEEEKSTSSSSRGAYSSPASPAKGDISASSGITPGRSNSRELVRKLMPGTGSPAQMDDVGTRKYGSSEKVVYSVNKAHGDKGSGTGALYHIKNMVVKTRRHSKERGDGRSESRDKDDKKKHLSQSTHDHEKEHAFALLDSVIDSYHHKSGSNGSSSGTTKRSKKREKEKSGGTWPKYRGGGPLSTWDGGTIMHRSRKERPPLSMFFPNTSTQHYTREEKQYDTYNIHDKHLSPRQSSSPRGTPTSPHGKAFSIYQSHDGAIKTSSYSSASQVYTGVHTSSQSSAPSYSSQQSSLYPSQDIYSASPRNQSVDRKHEESDRERDGLISLTPSDTSLDFSVKSGVIDGEKLEYYVRKKNIVKYPPSDSESTMSPIDTGAPSSLNLPGGYSSRPSAIHIGSSSSGGDRTPSHSRITHTHTGLYSPPPSSVLRSPPSFTSYSPLPAYSITHSHGHPHTSLSLSGSTGIPPRYSSPPALGPLSHSPFLGPTTSRSGESILSSPGPEGVHPRDLRYYEQRLASSPVGSAAVFYHHSATPSLEIGGYHKPRTHLHNTYRSPIDEQLGMYSGPPSYHEYQANMGTIGRKNQDERSRIPSNLSVGSKSSGGGGIGSSSKSNSSMERGSSSVAGGVGEGGGSGGGSGSPGPRSFPEGVDVGVSGHGGSVGGHRTQQHITQISSTNSAPHYPYHWQRKPHPGELRNIYIEKSAEPLGIQIRCLENGGVYVSSVTVNSLASQVGLCVGDQLLEVCGINMRSATKQLASTVLSQCGTSVTMLVQYNPDSSLDDEDLPPSSSSTLRSPLDVREAFDLSSLPPSARSTLTPPEIQHVMNTLKRQDTIRRSEKSNNSGPSNNNSSSSGEPRVVYLDLNKTHNLGIQMVGGNAQGIFIHAATTDSPASKAGLRPGDHILEYNGMDLRHATAELAACELAKPAEKVTMLVQYNYARYEEIQDQPGDSFYIRTMFDRGEVGESSELMFRKEDILYVDNTMFNNMPGLWRAWLVDEDGHKRHCGTVPSKDKVDEELLLQRSLGELPIDSSRRGSTSARRSFFRRKKHSRSSSRDSKELASFSDASLNSYTETQPLHDDPSPLSYIRVERLDYLMHRPVVLVGPLWELVCDKLVHDYPHKFRRCVPEVSRHSTQEMEAAVRNNLVVDYRRRGSHFEATTVNQVKEICDENCHGILDISLGSVERLHYHNIYPIVVLLKYRYHKQIREVCDPSAQAISQKEAKEMFEVASKNEHEYKHIISAVITAVNMAYNVTQVKTCVDQEQSKTLWVPSGSL